MKFIKKIITIVFILLMSVCVFSSSKMTVEDFKNELSSIKMESYTTFECEIEIEMDNKILSMTKMYKKGEKSRMEIKGDKNMGIGDIVIIQDTSGTYTKEGKNKWIKSNNMSLMGQYGMIDTKAMLEEMVKKERFEVEDYKNKIATIRYKEENYGTVSDIRVGIDMSKGRIIFQEIEMNNGFSRIIYEYGEQSGKMYIKELKIDTRTALGNKQMNIRIKNVKIDKKINDKIFKRE